jgi:hypothetical protein
LVGLGLDEHGWSAADVIELFDVVERDTYDLAPGPQNS